MPIAIFGVQILWRSMSLQILYEIQTFSPIGNFPRNRFIENLLVLNFHNFNHIGLRCSRILAIPVPPLMQFYIDYFK